MKFVKSRPVPANIRLFTASFAALMFALAALLTISEPAHAATACPTPTAGVPAISIAKEAPSEVLYGEDFTVKLTASEGAGETYGGFNLSFRDVLPVGAHYVPGSSSPEPRIVADAPSLGQTTLVWSNVADLAPGSDFSVSYDVSYDTDPPGPPTQPNPYAAGDSVVTGDVATNAAGAYVNCDPRRLPRFGANGLPVGLPSNSYSSSATTTPSSTELKALKIEKAEPSPEHELMRGVHDQQTVYTLTVTNNSVSATDNVQVEDFLPAGLEFLGCGAVDNTTDAPTNPGSNEEYPGSGAINPGNAPPAPDCIQPDIVETVLADPNGSGTALYTRVVWQLNTDMLASGSFKIQYVAAIPMCPNTDVWSGGSAPSGASLGQIANLDNNGPCVEGLADNTALTNTARATGDYQGVGGGTVSDDDSLTVTAQDLSVVKAVLGANPTLAPGGLLRWRLLVRTGEYEPIDNTVLDDLLPDGLCPVDGTANNYEHTPPPAEAECNGTGNAADNPTVDGMPTTFAGPQAVPTENADGTWNVVFDLGDLAINEDFDVDFSSRTRTEYQENFDGDTPVLSGDSVTNNVDISGTDSDGDTATDDSSASVSAGFPVLDKQGMVPGLASPVNCSTGSYVNTSVGDYRPGDIACWKLNVTFPAATDTDAVTLSDYLPVGTVYASPQPTGTGPTGNSDFNAGDVTVTPDPGGRFVDFALSSPGGFVGEDLVFEWIIASKITNVDPDDPGADLPDLRGNLLKMTTENTAGEATTLRDEVDLTIAQPELAVTKGVKRINGIPAGGNPPNTDGGSITGSQPVEYRIDVTNGATIDAVGTQVSERLVGPYNCAMITAITAGGTCIDDPTPGPNAVTIVRWTALGVDAGDSIELNFTVTYPPTIPPFIPIPDNACVDTYQNETNDPGDTTFDWAPVNPTAACGSTTWPGAPAPEANDDSYVTPEGAFTKTLSTDLTEPNNNGPDQATIGEEFTYRIGVSIANNTTVTDLTITDTLQNPTRQTYVAGSVTCGSSLAGMCNSPTFVDFGVSAPNQARLRIPGAWTNATGTAVTIWLEFKAKLADLPANAAGATLNNQGTVSMVDPWGNTQSAPTNETTLTVVEPSPSVTKTNDASGALAAGDEVEYTVAFANASGRSPLHNATGVDNVPVGLTPTNGSGVPVPNGGTVFNCSGVADTGVWDSTARTITWALGTINGGGSVAHGYCAEVDPNSPAGSVLTNEVDLTGTSMPGTVTGERTYARDDDSNVTVVGASTTKSATPANAPVGQIVDYTVGVTLPADVQFYDFRVIDQLPAGLTNFTAGSVTCTAGCGPNPGSPVPTFSSNTATWAFGDIAAHSAARTLAITYTATVADVVGNQSGTTLTNTVNSSWRTAGGGGGTLIETPDVTETVTVTEPNLTIDKDVNCQTGDADACNVQPGDSFTYSITIDNTGTGTAYDAIVQDQVPDGLTNVVVGALPPGVTTATPTAPNTHAFQISSLAPADAPIVITYTADLAASSNFNDGETVVNTARISEYWGLDAADRAATDQEREYPEGGEPTDTVTLTVNVPQPNVVKTVADSGNAEIDQCLQWTLTVSNQSSVADLNDIEVVDTLPAGWQYCAGTGEVDGSPSEPTVTAGPTLTWANVGDIAGGGADIVVTFSAMPTLAALTAGEPTNPYTNDVEVSGVDASGSGSSGDGPYEDTDSEDANIQMPELTITKTPDGETVAPGTWNNWTIQVTNNGDAPARDLVIRDAVPAGLFYNFATHDASATCTNPLPTPCDNFVRTSVANSGTGPNNITWSLDSLAVGETITITVPMYVDADVVDAVDYVNNAYVSSAERPTEITDDADWTTEREADMQIVKSDGGANGVAGENVTYTLTVTNNGPSNASGITINDVIDTDDFAFVSITRSDPDDNCLTTGAPVVNEIDCSVAGELAPTESRTFTLVLQIKPGVTTTVSNTATVDANENDPDPDNNTSTETTPVGVQPTLTIEKTISSGSPSTILNGDETEFTITVTNAGPSDAVNVPIEDVLPAGLSCVSVSVTSSGCNGVAGETVTLTLPSILAPPGTNTATFTMVVRGEAVGSQVNTASIDQPGGDSDTETVVVDPMADMEIVKDGPATAASGSDITYTLTVTNNGPDAADDVVVTDTLPAAVTWVSTNPSVGSCAAPVSGVISCNLGDMAAAATATIQITVNVGWTHSEQTIVNDSEVTSSTGDSDPSNNEDDASTDIGPNADVAVVKSGPAWGAAGHPLQYTISVTNNGPAVAEDVTLNDPLPAGLTFVSATPTVGTCSEVSANVVECDLGDMAPGAAIQIVVVATPDDSVIGTSVVNTATATSPTPDPDTSNNESTAQTPIENNAYPTSSDLVLTKTASTSTPAVGDSITYTLTATNNGPSDAPNSVIVDTLPGTLIFQSASAGCSAAGQVVTCQLGTVPAGQSRGVQIQVIVAAAGSIVNTATVTSPNDRDPGNNSATDPVVVNMSSAKIRIDKKASRKSARVGGKVSWSIKVTNVSKTRVVNLRVCDTLPSRLTVTRRGGGTLTGGRLCWTVPYLDPGKSRSFRFTSRVTNGRGSKVVNSVRATATNARSVRSRASVRVPQVADRSGGATG